MNQTRNESTVWSGNTMLQALAPNGTVNIVDLSCTLALNQILMHWRIVWRIKQTFNVFNNFFAIQVDALVLSNIRKFLYDISSQLVSLDRKSTRLNSSHIL